MCAQQQQTFRRDAPGNPPPLFQGSRYEQHVRPGISCRRAYRRYSSSSVSRRCTRRLSLNCRLWNAPPSTEHHVGKVVWADLVTPDLAAAEHFYGGLLGWTFQPIHAGNSDYAIALADGRPARRRWTVPGDSCRRTPPVRAADLFIAVRDVDAAKPHGAIARRQSSVRFQELSLARTSGRIDRSGGRRFCDSRI